MSKPDRDRQLEIHNQRMYFVSRDGERTLPVSIGVLSSSDIYHVEYAIFRREARLHETKERNAFSFPLSSVPRDGMKRTRSTTPPHLRLASPVEHAGLYVEAIEAELIRNNSLERRTLERSNQPPGLLAWTGDTTQWIDRSARALSEYIERMSTDPFLAQKIRHSQPPRRDTRPSALAYSFGRIFGSSVGRGRDVLL